MLDTERLCLGCMNDNGGEKVCSICGYDSKVQNPPECLPVKSWLKQRYYIGAVKESNCEGITYIAWDNEDDRIVDIREYFPKGAALRNSDMSVGIEKGNEFAFNDGIMEFIDLNRKLQSLEELPALAGAVEVFEDNGTAYSVTKSVPGITLREFLIRNGGNLSWEQARPLFLPVITTLTELHEAGIIHRGISPETIIVGRDGKLRLNSFCIKPIRMSNSNMTIQLFPGYAAVEQYGYDIEQKDGTYTDVYGIAATLFRALMGKAPTDVTERISNDNLQISARYAEKIPKFVLTALANALQIMPENRTQNMDEFRISLTPVASDTATVPKLSAVIKNKTAKPDKIEDKQKSNKNKKDNNDNSKKAVIVSVIVTALIFVVIAVALYFILRPGDSQNTDNQSKVSDSNAQVSEIKPNIIIPEDKDALYQVPDVVGKTYAEVLNNIDYTLNFEFVENETEFSNDYERGYIIDQEPKSDQSVKKGTEIKLKVSAGSRKITVPNVIGKTEKDAVYELLKKGFLFDNIQILETHDTSKPDGQVIATEPAAKTKISRNAGVVVRVNSNPPVETSSEEETSEYPSQVAESGETVSQ